MNDVFRIFIGYDAKEEAAFQVLADSIWRRASHLVSITPLKRSHLQHLYTRSRGPTEATDFSLTRFLVPALCDYQGYALFLDCDMLCHADIHELWLYTLTQPEKAVWVCQHDYIPKTLTKMDGQEQTKYPCKNWSSLMLFDCAKCEALTPDYINTASGLDLHRFHWTAPESIGSLPLEWNWLVGEYPVNPQAKILHFTLGGPWHLAPPSTDHFSDWYTAYEHLTRQATPQ